MQSECRKAYISYMFKAICDPYQAGRKKKSFSGMLNHCAQITVA